MKKLIHQFSDYLLWQIEKDMMPEVSRFVVETNYKHHQGSFPVSIENEIMAVCEEEKSYFPDSVFFLIEESTSQKVIGTIRVFRWTGKCKLPAQEEYAVDMQKIIDKERDFDGEIWHVGRLAIDIKKMGRASVLILKTLLVNGFQSACPLCGSLVFAELDRKLFEKFRLMDIYFNQIGESKICLGSETVPTYITSKGLSSFLEKHKHLCYV